LGKTIVASDLPVFRELLTGRENAMIVDPEDAAKFADALTNLVQDAGSMSRAQLKVAGGGWVDDTTLQLAQRQAERG
jgi:glycosyltransferase involved in cell wall biosynthesis